ncbi:hypothetical protein O5D80_007640 [Batrachochytrium dendrobatidis]|nr:hypothetical protein O5D80_007640 [Batrachochytrium dendrobatidis]
MVSFSCEVCQETIKKPKLEQHYYRCPRAYYSCVDCSTTFQGTDYRAHTSCISEAEKYQKSVYKPPKGKKNQDAASKNTTKISATPNVVKATTTPSLISQIKKTEAETLEKKANSDSEQTTMKQEKSTKVKKRKADFGSETKSSKQSKAEEPTSASSSPTPADANESISSDCIRSALDSIFKKSSDLSFGTVREKLVKKLQKNLKNKSLDSSIIQSRLDDLVTISSKDGIMYFSV